MEIFFIFPKFFSLAFLPPALFFSLPRPSNPPSLPPPSPGNTPASGPASLNTPSPAPPSFPPLRPLPPSPLPWRSPGIRLGVPRQPLPDPSLLPSSPAPPSFPPLRPGVPRHPLSAQRKKPSHRLSSPVPPLQHSLDSDFDGKERGKTGGIMWLTSPPPSSLLCRSFSLSALRQFGGRGEPASANGDLGGGRGWAEGHRVLGGGEASVAVFGSNSKSQARDWVSPG